MGELQSGLELHSLLFPGMLEASNAGASLLLWPCLCPDTLMPCQRRGGSLVSCNWPYECSVFFESAEDYLFCPGVGHRPLNVRV